jgi:NADPH:quinone reductase
MVSVSSALKRPSSFPPGKRHRRVIPHGDGAGAIDAAGDGVAEARIGEPDWVYGAQSYRPFGTAAEFVAVPQEKAVPLPGGVDFATGACPGISARTAHRCVFADAPIAGQTVPVAGGAGNVGPASRRPGGVGRG